MSEPTEAQIKDQFTRYYMQHLTTAFADDLDAVRGADDFVDATSLPMLVRALSQGIDLYTVEEMRRVILGGKRADEVGGKEESEGVVVDGGDGEGKKRKRRKEVDGNDGKDRKDLKKKKKKAKKGEGKGEK